MDSPRLSPLDHRHPAVAAEINRVMRAGYMIEATLLGVADFVPVRRTAVDIAAARSLFLGAFLADRLVAVAEIETRRTGAANIASLVVHPDHFRKGLGTALLGHIVASHGDRDITVTTGIQNEPALRLYARFDFGTHSQWRTRDGIPIITLIRRSAAAVH